MVYNEIVMGNNPVLVSQSTQTAAQSEKNIAASSAKVKELYEGFLNDLARVKHEHRDRIDAILKTIDERQIKDLKEKLKNI